MWWYIIIINNPIMLRWLGEWVRGLTVGLLLLDLHVHFFWGGAVRWTTWNCQGVSRKFYQKDFAVSNTSFGFAASSVRWCHARGDFGKILFWTAMVGYRQPPNFVEHPSRDIGIPFWLVASMCKFFDLSFSLSAKLKLFWAGSGWAKVMSLSQLDKFFTCGEP